MSEIENNSGRSRPTENEFNRIVEVLNSTKHKAMFRTWVANFTNRERQVKTFDGAALKFIRIKKNLNLHKASKQTELSAGQISKIENGLKPVNLDLRNRIMIAYGYSPTSFKNLSTDPVRSKVVPISYKLEILLNTSEESQIEKIFSYIQSCIIQDHENNKNQQNFGG